MRMNPVGKRSSDLYFFSPDLCIGTCLLIYNSVATPLKAFMLQVKQDHARIIHVHLHFNLGEMSF
jgi:metal-responsive CopG/Arc/MetJ family transcriptional regulator